MKKKEVALTATGGVGGGLIGFTIGRLSSTDLRAIIERLIDLFKEQGPYALFALLITILFVGFFIWFVKLLVEWKEKEISRIAIARDKFEQLFINEWKSTRREQLEESRRNDAVAVAAPEDAKAAARRKKQ